MKPTSQSAFLLYVALFLMLFGNITFFSNIMAVYPLNLANIGFLLSLAVVFGAVIVILLSLVCYQKTIKAVLIITLILSAMAAYFMDSYHIIIDDVMIDNVLKTDVAESFDLLSGQLFLYLIFLALIPAIFIYKTPLLLTTKKQAVIARLKLVLGAFGIALVLILLFGHFYASFFREHKSLRFYSNPSYYLYSVGKTISGIFKQSNQPLQTLGLDARIPAADEHRELVVFVVGETARADHFSLNGYARKTNPYLEQQKDVISFNNFWSCGTSTAVSVPCMFSVYGRKSYDKNKAKNTENVLDILQHSGVNVLWLDNNSDSKGVATRVPYESYKTADINPICDQECRDEGMLSHLQAYIDAHPQGDIFIVLHQMGNHGPAYYKRYPPQFKKFTPSCQTNQLEQCSNEEINNAYDNAILYTDYFLSQTIDLLKNNNEKFESSLFYISDHGESLGEKGLYLHGLPYFIAPDEQKHVPMIVWLSDSFDNRQEKGFEQLKTKANKPYSHDNLFHTILGVMEIETSSYQPEMDLIKHHE